MGNEAFSRVLIDKALEFSGWDLLDPHQVRFELNSVTGRADYVLSGQRGPLCVAEAKREELDPYDAKEQARGYAENLKAPFVILSNGREHWFWNYTRKDQDAYRIERLPSLADLERLRLKNLQPPRPLMSEVIGPDWLKPFKFDLVLRRYQIMAIDILCTLFDLRRLRKFLLEMATGTGKTPAHDLSCSGESPPRVSDVREFRCICPILPAKKGVGLWRQISTKRRKHGRRSNTAF